MPPALCHQWRRLPQPFPKAPLSGSHYLCHQARLQSSGKLIGTSRWGWIPYLPPPKSLLSQNKPRVLAMLTELYDKSLLLGQIAVRKPLQCWNSLAESLERHFSKYLRLPACQSLRVLVKRQMTRLLKVGYSHNPYTHQRLTSARLTSSWHEVSLMVSNTGSLKLGMCCVRYPNSWFPCPCY